MIEPQPRRPGLLILAAGRSRRLGECKALVDLAGRSPLERLVEAAAGVADGAPPLVVTGADHEAISSALPPGVEVIHNRHWARGRTGGVDLARRERPGLDLFLAPVDVPLVPAEVFETLLDEWIRSGSPPNGWLAPAAGGPPPKPGHPVLLGCELLSGIERLGADEPLFRLRGRARPLWTVPVSSMAIHDDLDTPRDLETLRVRLGRN